MNYNRFIEPSSLTEQQRLAGLEITEARIKKITKAYIRTYTDSGQVTAYIEFMDTKGVWGRTEGDPSNPHMKALLKRAKREGVKVNKEKW